MQYHILGKTVEIFAMSPSEGLPECLFEFRGDKRLEEIGLKERFYFRAPDHFYLDLSGLGAVDQKPKVGVYQQLLSLYLEKSISSGRLEPQ